MKTVYALAIILILAVIGAVGFAFSGLYDVGASSSHSTLVGWLLETTADASIEKNAGDIVVPDLSDESLTLAGVNDFADMCAACHGAPGQMPESVGQGLNPPPPDLAQSAARLSPAELFWVTKHGIRMTGMPSWGLTHDDDALWPVVAFMTTLPDLDAAEYKDQLARSKGLGHHSPDQAHDHDGADHTEVSGPVDAPAQHVDEETEHDHADHDH